MGTLLIRVEAEGEFNRLHGILIILSQPRDILTGGRDGRILAEMNGAHKYRDIQSQAESMDRNTLARSVSLPGVGMPSA